MRMMWHIRVYGMVQGVGYRPFVAELAEKLGITGKVKNAGGIVEIDASGETKAMEEFLRRLCISCPKGARVDKVEKEGAVSPASLPERGFLIEESIPAEEPMRLLPPDLATCEACEEELFTPGNRRFHHPFISCALCGPRYSILKQVPYDREHVTMDVFPLCDDCAGEYQRPGDRRRHAQTICCPSCGPELSGIATAYLDGIFLGNAEKDTGEEALEEAIFQIKNGGIVAVKDIGGFHFVFLPENQPAERLREMKHREAKPFAVCFPSLASVSEYCNVTVEEEKLLCSAARPIVLLDWHRPLPEGILKGSSRIGAMLPCNPLQMLLTRELGPLVMTSGNRGNEPIITHTAQMNSLMKEGCPDYILTHNRRILSPLDDSIYQVVPLSKGSHITQIIRRARGIVPEPIILNEELINEKFAAGSDLKAVFAYGKGKAAYLSPHFGDLIEFSCVQAREHEMDRMKALFGLKPRESVGDLHPGFLSAEGAKRRVQHHYAHILSVMAEHGLRGPILGLAFDGTGYGTDGRIWGSEFLLCSRERFEKVSSLRPVVFPGGDAAAKHPSLALTAYLRGAGISYGDPVMDAALEKGIHTVENCSMGRLFDAASALLTGCRENTYEGQGAAELELLAEKAEEAYPLTLPRVPLEGMSFGDGPELIRMIHEAVEEGADPAALAMGFHLAVADFAVEMADRIAREKEIQQIALSGGSFVNRILLRKIVLPLRQRGYAVFCNEKVPCGDGGLALGQLWAL